MDNPTGKEYVEYLKTKLKGVNAARLETMTELKSLGGIVSDNPTAFTDEELCDIGFFCREIMGVMDDLRKECRAKMILVDKTLAAKVILDNINEKVIPNIRGLHNTGTVKVKDACGIPKTGSPEHIKLCEFFGINSADLKGIVRFSYNSLADLITELKSQGKNPPDGILKTWPEYTIVHRKKR